MSTLSIPSLPVTLRAHARGVRGVSLACLLIALLAAAPLLAQPATDPAALPQDAKTLHLVGPRDTLMSISRDWAREWAAESGVTLAQSMYGIYRANPQAFGPRGMNELLLGATLRLPSPDELRAIPRREALDAVSRELGIWVGPKVIASVVDPVQVDPAPVGAVKAEELPTAVEPSVDERLARLENEWLGRQRELEAKLAALESRPSDAASLSEWLERWGLWLALAGLGGILFAGIAAINLWRRTRESPEEGGSAGAAVVSRSKPDAAPKFEVPRVTPKRFTAEEDGESESFEGDPPPLQDTASMIHLARAYVEMGDVEAARSELRFVMQSGNENQRREAERLLADL